MHSTLPYSGSHIENWHSILRNGLVNASYTKLQVRLCSFFLFLHPLFSVLFSFGKVCPRVLSCCCLGILKFSLCVASLGRKLELYV